MSNYSSASEDSSFSDSDGSPRRLHSYQITAFIFIRDRAPVKGITTTVEVNRLTRPSEVVYQVSKSKSYRLLLRKELGIKERDIPEKSFGTVPSDYVREEFDYKLTFAIPTKRKYKGMGLYDSIRVQLEDGIIPSFHLKLIPK